jgi:RNA polymerase-binding transcription factor DksA
MTVQARLEEMLRPMPLVGVVPIADDISDEGDAMSLASEQAMAMGRLNQKAVQLTLARVTLAWLKAKNFGTCIQCREPIVAKRLDVAYCSPFCFNCQDEFEVWLKSLGRVPEPSRLYDQILHRAAAKS